jgi:hypothetical protein
MNMKKTTLLSCLVIIFVCYSAVAEAASPSWFSEQYTANALGYKSYGPPLPVSRSYSIKFGGSSQSIITSTNMYTESVSHWFDANISASTSFDGIYLATSASPHFLFTYDGYFTSSGYGFISSHYAWFRASDLTSGSTLYAYTQLALDNGSHSIYVPTVAGHYIQIEFGAMTEADRSFGGDQTETVSLNYSMAVVPEPVSSILFLTGGVLLGGRHYFGRKAG